MYSVLLYAHSWLRWIVLILALITIYKSFIGSRGGVTYQKSDNAIAASFVGTIHLMFLLGLGLYFLSPFAFQAFGSGANVMKEASLRYWAVEHITVMLIGIVLISIGRGKSKRAGSDQEKFKKQLIFFSIGIIIMLTRIPWTEAGRLFRF